jgi:hypothetical protein
MLIRLRLLPIIGAYLLSACAHTGSMNQAYLSAARRPDASVPGNVLVVTSPGDDAHQFVGSPTSLTGAAWTLTLPIGQIARESAVAAYSDVFRGGATPGAKIPEAGGYSYLISPKLLAFSYEYNQLKNAGFAITPTAVIKLRVSVLDANGQPRWSRDYDSGPVEGPAYVLNASPQEEIIKLAHRAAYETLLKSARDVAVEVKPAAP